MAAAHNGDSENHVSVDIDEASFRGFTSSLGVANFLGVPFATISGRFRPAQLLKPASLSGTTVDVTKYGPKCPQPENFGRRRRLHLYEGVQESEVTTSEFDCLRLNIYTPSTSISSMTSSKLPVLIYIHGGGWIFGDGNSEYDGNFLVHESLNLQKPFIFVTVNYRLGYLGFLHSRELRAEAERNNENYCPNLGLHDQRLALQWVRDNIHFFGGDTSNVTVAGQSAGAWSALSHTVTSFPLCRRALIMSPTVISFSSDDECQAAFDQLVTRTGTSLSASAEEKLVALRQTSLENMSLWLDGSVLIRPAWDHQWFTTLDGPERLDQVSRFPDWIDGIMIGATKNETINIKPFWATLTTEQIHKVVRSLIPDADMKDEIMHTYGLDSKTHPDVLSGLVDLTTDAFFGLFPHVLGDLEMPISVFRFDQPDTFEPSVFKGYAYHCIDTPFLCRLPAVAGPKASKAMQKTADAVTKATTEFVYGIEPWEPYHISNNVMSFNGDESGVIICLKEEKWRRFVNTKQRMACLVDTSRLLMTFNFKSIPSKTDDL
ncbi:hypothetical protein V496_02088 [Pseudogymnoascus sp. VKM F-4515 (FW-2607)]|nr:hypothetical protein V496_02088 [Pseudogymnoascus sp. VKM F-4515 (FW-2607)]KFY89953.1 hypothetical protein V498_06225 [Pseudogymnoascus sp. VKM F-4517 (FW-2822)]